jgi:hypothetical protein
MREGWPYDNTGIRAYCEMCGVVPVYLETFRKDDLNPYPNADLVCTNCALVLMTFQADEEGILQFIPLVNKEE